MWRYLDLTKLIALLSTGTLYFPAADCLGDPWEGAGSKPDQKRREGLPPDVDQSHYVTFRRELVHGTYISCWHENNAESAAMWKLYLKSDEGVAVKTTYGRLEECLKVDCEFLIFGGKVAYLNYERDFVADGSPFTPFFRKRQSFAHEKEFRAVISPFIQAGKYRTPFPIGLTLPVNYHLLIEDVYVAPDTSDWVKNVVQSVVTKFGLDRAVRRSSLSDDPIY